MYAIITQQFPDCFGEIRKLPGGHHITVDPAVPPVVHPPLNCLERQARQGAQKDGKNGYDQASSRSNRLGQQLIRRRKIQWKASIMPQRTLIRQ